MKLTPVPNYYLIIITTLISIILLRIVGNVPLTLIGWTRRVLGKGSVSHPFVTVAQVACWHQGTSRRLRDLWPSRHVDVDVDESIRLISGIGLFISLCKPMRSVGLVSGGHRVDKSCRHVELLVT